MLESDFKERLGRKAKELSESLRINTEYMSDEEVFERIKEEMRRMSERDRDMCEKLQSLERVIGSLRDELRNEREIHRDKVESLTIQLRQVREEG
jgi:chromosome segregation ATPase